MNRLLLKAGERPGRPHVASAVVGLLLRARWRSLGDLPESHAHSTSYFFVLFLFSSGVL